MKLFLIVAAFLGLSCVGPASAAGRSGKTYNFPIYKNNPPGKQLSGAYAPADSPPLAPEETQKKFKVPKGFEVRLFASEPEVVNPVATTWDERGRLWVLELYEYPKGVPKGQKGRDRIKILEDTDADGKADKVTVFADGYSLATGLALGNGGVYLGVAPDLLFLEDTNGDDKADRTTVLKTGFGMEDRHELLNGFAWGPDGWLYMTHGVFTHSKVRDQNDPDGFGVQVDAALARYHPRTKKFEVFADGTSNPWGVDWNERGDAFVSACVIHHLFHMAPSGQYNRQGGTWANPYGYVGDLPSKGLPAIVDWRHYRAAHSGICIYQGDQWPADWRGLVFLGNIHQSAINCDRLIPVGSTYRAEKESKLLGPSNGDWDVGAGNFLVCDDHWFRPVSVQTGPDGAMWIADWSDKYPCYQNAQADPDGVDRELGRIWRVVWTGDQPGKSVPSRPQRDMNLAKLSTDELAGLLEHPNNWRRRMAQRLIAERQDPKLTRTHNASSKIHDLMNSDKPTDFRLAALWTLHASGALEDDVLDDLKKDKDPAIRAWVARLTGERGYPFGNAMNRLSKLALDTNASVRLAVAAAARQFVSGSLTVDTSPAIPLLEVVTGGVLSDLHKSPFDPNDPVLPFVYWMALEPIVAFDAGHALDYYKNAKDKSESEWPMNPYILARIMRRVCDLSDPDVREKHLNKAMEILGGLASETRLADAALDGLIASFRSKAAPPTIPLEPILAKLAANPALADKARHLATLLGDTTASRALIAKVNDSKASVEDRLKGIQAARETKDDAARRELLKLLRESLTLTPFPPKGESGRRTGEGSSEKAQLLYAESIRALSAFDGDEIAYGIVGAWKNLALPTRRVAAEVLVTRSKWSRALLAGVDNKIVEPQDISATARRALARSSDSTVADHASRVLGRYRATGEDKLNIIAEKRKVVLAAKPNVNAGHEMARRACLVCHKLYGEGADVGPDLTGVGRSTLDALLHNVIDPNEVIGNGFENTEVELKDGRVLNGRIVEDSPTRLKLVASGPTEHFIARSDIAMDNGKPSIRTSELSLMPEGLEQMPDADFRNLIWFLLNPPEDGRPMTPQLWRELTGEEMPADKSACSSASGQQSFALWDPQRRVIGPNVPGIPQKAVENAGRRKASVLHPFSRENGVSTERQSRLTTGPKTSSSAT